MDFLRSKSCVAIFWICMGAKLVNKFLLIDATDKSKISSDQKRFFITLSLYPLSFSANTPFNIKPITLNWTKGGGQTYATLVVQLCCLLASHNFGLTHKYGKTNLPGCTSKQFNSFFIINSFTRWVIIENISILCAKYFRFKIIQ